MPLTPTQKQDIERKFNDNFYEGRGNDVFCKEHHCPATLPEIKKFMFKIIDEVINNDYLILMGKTIDFSNQTQPNKILPPNPIKDEE